MYELRNYQIEAIEKIKELNPGEVGLLSLSTGSGKTIIFSSVASQIQGRVLIIVPSTEIRLQTIDKLKSICDSSVTIGSVQANINQLNCNIVVCTRQSLSHKKSTRIENMLQYGDFELIFIDEAHQACNQIKMILDKLDTSKAKVVGLTATPYNPEMTKIFSNITYSKNILWFIENNYLCQPKAYMINTQTDISHVSTLAGEFNQKQLENTINTFDRNELIVQGYQDYAKDRLHTLVFCSGIDHARELCDKFNENGISCATVDSTITKDEREQILKDFKNGKYSVVTNVSCLTTGYDFPELDCIIFATPIQSKIKYQQSMGRGLRIAEGKENVLILDFKDSTTKHDLMSVNDIFDVKFKNGETLTEAKIRTEEEFELEEQIRLEEEAWKKEEERQRKIKEELIAKEIELFNSNFGIAFTSKAYFDWFKVDYNIYAITESQNTHFAIMKDDELFYAYKIFKPGYYAEAEEIFIFDNISEAIDYVENIELTDCKSFATKDAIWKANPATAKQKAYIKNCIVNTKWEAHQYFAKYLIKKCIEKLRKEIEQQNNSNNNLNINSNKELKWEDIG